MRACVVRSHAGHSAVKANFGATEGYIFLLDKSFLFISKAPLFLPYADINEVRFERVSGALTSSARTFDLIVQMKAGKQEHTFSAVSKEEQGAIEEFLKRDKKLRVKNIIEENLNAVNSELVAAMMDEDSDDDDAPKRGGGDDEDEDSEVDEDFKAPDSDDEDDVAEEFDEVRAQIWYDGRVGAAGLTDWDFVISAERRKLRLFRLGRL